MVRLILAQAALLVTTLAAAAQSGEPSGRVPTLKREAVVSGELVRIGDLVENAGSLANTPIFRAPDLGQTGAVGIHRVLDALRPHGLTRLEAAGVNEVVVSRASRLISLKDIEAHIARAVADQLGLPDPRNIAVNLDRDARPVHVEPAVTGHLPVVRLNFDARSGRFDIALDIPGPAGGSRTSLRFTGRAAETRDVVVLTRAMSRGEPIKAADVAIERRSKADAADAIGTLEAAIGLAPRRAFAPGQTLRTVDLTKPEIVVRNEAVTILFEAPGMTLTLRGRALESGAQGDLVNVVNLQTKRTIQAVVSGPGRVNVSGSIGNAGPNPANKMQTVASGDRVNE